MQLCLVGCYVNSYYTIFGFYEKTRTFKSNVNHPFVANLNFTFFGNYKSVAVFVAVFNIHNRTLQKIKKELKVFDGFGAPPTHSTPTTNPKRTIVII